MHSLQVLLLLTKMEELWTHISENWNKFPNFILYVRFLKIVFNLLVCFFAWMVSDSKSHAKRLDESHDQLLQSTLETGSYSKLYSFKHIVNGFAVHTTSSQVLSNLLSCLCSLQKNKNKNGAEINIKHRNSRIISPKNLRY